MTQPTLYLWFPGTARTALRFYQQVFGGELTMNTYADFGRTDGPANAVAHGLLNGPVTLYATDARASEPPLLMQGLSIALLGTAEPAVSERWFESLSEGGTIIDPLTAKEWNATDGQVQDAFGVRWLIGFEH